MIIQSSIVFDLRKFRMEHAILQTAINQIWQHDHKNLDDECQVKQWTRHHNRPLVLVVAADIGWCYEAIIQMNTHKHHQKAEYIKTNVVEIEVPRLDQNLEVVREYVGDVCIYCTIV